MKLMAETFEHRKYSFTWVRECFWEGPETGLTWYNSVNLLLNSFKVDLEGCTTVPVILWPAAVFLAVPSRLLAKKPKKTAVILTGRYRLSFRNLRPSPQTGRRASLVIVLSKI